MYRRHKFAAALIATGLSGCGLSVPQIGELWDQDRPADPQGTPTLTATAQIEYEIKQKVYCELSYAVEQVTQLKISGTQAIPDNWGVQMQLSLEVDESVSLNPGVTFTQLLPNVMKIFGVFPNKAVNSVTTAQSFSLGFGGILSSEALRTDKFNTYYSIKDLRQRAALHLTPCQPGGKPDPQQDYFAPDWTPAGSSLLIQSDLGLKDWLVGAMLFDSSLHSSPQPAAGSSSSNGKFTGTFQFKGPLQGQANGTFSGTTSGGGKSSSGGGSGGGGSSSGNSGSSSGDSGFKQDSFSQEIKFIIISTGNITPTWKLIQLSANTGNAPFFSTGRTRTHDLLITIGPPTQRTQSDFLALQIGQAVNRGVVRGTP
jgi:uncharacterized membrane protein YgcG